MSALYKYQALEIDAPYIRLMTILPDEAESPIRITLRHANLADEQRPSYETVSYVWGDPTRSACLKVSGHGVGPRYRCLYVPASTAAVLNRIRMPDQKRTVWQDAVCINEDDLVERGHQVSLMGKIYSGSMGNIVYLGELDDPAMGDRISTTISTLFSDAERNTCGFSTFWTTITDEATGASQHNYGEKQYSVDPEAVTFMLELPWFRRLWTLQEAALAPKNTAILGDLRFDLIDILRAMEWWVYGHAQTYSTEAQAGLHCMGHALTYIDHNQSHMTGSFRSVEGLLVCAMQFEKSEPRDGVFAIQSLLSYAMPQLLVPEYTKPLSEILQTATRLAFMEQSNLELLRWVTIWPGDLDRAHVASWVLRVDRQHDPAVDAIMLCNGFAAAGRERRLGDDTSLTLESLNSATLLTRGYIVGEVETLSRVCTMDYNYGTWLIWIREVFDLYRMRVASQNLLQTRRAFALTLWGGGVLRETTQLATDGKLKPLDEFADLLWNTAEEHIEQCAITLYEALTKIGVSLKGDYRSNRRFFMMRPGRPGLGLGVMQSGDIITLIRGVRTTPMVLRPLSNGQYQLVGEAYVDGIMFGEAWKEFKTIGAVEEEFLLV
ncbi:hypothetical protein LTR56_009309 [Elasticomyces elasticus]|nr:hypothetical protein LTR56_009309 [Elasticomyces elasticus]KAK3666377.1 hypothetical protein LTR22_002681 [Elasticomyces elasticus]KAK4917756.1 hypothetical protein LTR49_014433 [Elasticomyces elasticus]KAK5766317.1 hypothetical protein LTS12_003528 [Elasticomyces elasticus]